jgi:HSP20 family protein
MNHLCYSLNQIVVSRGYGPPPMQRRPLAGAPGTDPANINFFGCNQEEKTIMAITRWDPFRDVMTLQNRMNSLFRDFTEGDGPMTTAGFAPAADIYEDEKKITIKLEVPGIEEKDLDVSVENNTLTIKGERKFEKEEKEENFHRIERRYGSFFRAFTLPSTVDTEHVAASYNAGVLKLELTKKPEAQPKQIKVNVGKTLAA